MKEIVQVKACERSDDLIAFLYGELSDVEARKFQRHLQECTGCSAEYANFGQVRESIIAWRDESLRAAPANFASEPAVTPRFTMRRSALAAIRNFFDLSPLWMKGAVAFASLLFCFCAILAVGYLRAEPKQVAYTQQQFDEAVAKEVKSQIARIQTQQALPKETPELAVKSTLTPTKAGPTKYPGARERLTRSENAVLRGRDPRRPLTRQERQELAADLRILSSKDDDELDLGDTINQSPQ